MIEMPDSLYSLPEFVEEPELRELYEVIIARFRREILEGITLNTVQELLLERIAYNYVMLRWRERNMTASQARNASASTADKNANNFWLSMTQEFNRLTQKEQANQEFKNQLLVTISQALGQAFEGLHPDVARPMQERIAQAFEEHGL